MAAAQALLDEEAKGEAALRVWASQHLNIEIGLALRSDNWAGAQFWQAQGRSGITLASILARCEVADVGIDGGGLDDLLGLAVLGREKDTGDWLHWAHAWAHTIAFDRRKSEAARWKDFADDGDLTIVETIKAASAVTIAVLALTAGHFHRCPRCRDH